MEIVVRAIVVFFVLWLVTRIIGRTTLGELSTFELILFVTMGDLVQQSITQQDYSLTAGVLAVSVFALLTIALSYVAYRWPWSRSFIRGTPVVVVRDGEPQLRAMGTQRMDFGDLAEAARQQGIRSLADVQVAVLETNGKVSFFSTSEDETSGAPEQPPVG